jgi:putative ABC transport system permease protein
MIKLLPLVWSMLWRRKLRTALTFSSIAVAFLLFGMLESFLSIFGGAVHLASSDYLEVFHRFGPIHGLPYAYRSQIAAIPGARMVEPLVILPIVYQDEQRNSTQVSLAVDPDVFFEDERFVASPEAQQAFRNTRDGMLAGRALAQRFGWKIGDRIPLRSPLVRRKDGSDHWDFQLVGLFDYNEKIFGKGASAMRAFMRYDYLDEARMDPGVVHLYFVKVSDPARMAEIGKSIERLFQNSAYPVKAQGEAEALRQQISQIGDVGLIITSILSAVFFTLVVVAGNTMMRVFRERIPELAMMKTLGFTDRTIAAMIAIESLVLCVSAGLAGLLAAWFLIKPLARAMADVLPFLRMEPSTVVAGLALAIALAAVASAIPAWQSARLDVVDGLRA